MGGTCISKLIVVLEKQQTQRGRARRSLRTWPQRTVACRPRLVVQLSATLQTQRVQGQLPVSQPQNFPPRSVAERTTVATSTLSATKGTCISKLIVVLEKQQTQRGRARRSL